MIMISVKSKWCYKMLNGEKTLEIRTTVPIKWKEYLSGKTDVKPEPEKCVIYCTKSQPYLIDMRHNDHVSFSYDLIDYYMARDDEEAVNGKIIAEFTLKDVILIKSHRYSSDGTHYQHYIVNEKILEESCLTEGDILDYGNGNDLYAWVIDELEVYEKPKMLNEYQKPLVRKNISAIDLFIPNSICLKLNRAPQSWCYVEYIGD